MATTSTVIEKARLAVFKKMTPDTQEVAKAFERKLGLGASGVVMLYFSMGRRINDVLADEGKYGSGALQQLANYLGIKHGTTFLYSIKGFSEAFDKDFVETTTAKPMANGDHMSLQHWLMLMKIEDEDKREKYIEKVLKESMSANDLEREVRAGAAGKTKNARQGGRKPKTPSSPILGLQRTFELANKLFRWEEVAEKSVFDLLDELEPDKVTETVLDKARQTLEIVGKAEESAKSMKEHLETNIERLEGVLTKRTEDAAEAYDEDEEKSKKDKKKVESNGHADVAKKKKKKKKTLVAAE